MHNRFKMIPIEREQTRQNVEEAFQWYQLHKYLSDVETKLTASAPRSDADMIRGSGGNHSSTETAGIKLAERDVELKRIEHATNHLLADEKRMILERYMAEMPNTDETIMRDMKMTRNTYYNMKNRAFYKLALALEIAVFIRQSPNKNQTSSKQK